MTSEQKGLDIQITEDFVKQELARLGPDASHDWWHVYRVRNLAKSLARQEGLTGKSVHLVEVAALLHDVQDWKYSHSENASRASVQAFLEAQGVSREQKDQILNIIAGVGFKDELGSKGKGETSPELACVQDADRLDAVGAIGIARCFTYGGYFKRVLHDPAVAPRSGLTKQQYTDKSVQQTTINHFHEKLLKLKDMMKTGAGRRMAEHRHDVMEQFLDEFHREWDAEA
ncbi:g13251 [Coccomyxa viridis]|uniref:G13251 protein n=1 Tax=Coccomyxa viridis TaxID=1274662 RepID=A0ABP1GCN3_9CHLO